MGTFYDMAIRLSMTTTGMTAGANAAIAMVQRLHTQAGLTGTQIDKLGKSLALFAIGAALTGAGLAGVGILKTWTKAAADLQSAMEGVALATTGTPKQLAALHQQTFITANKTQFSAVDIGNIEKIAATNGLNQRDVLLRVVPTLGNLAEIDNRLRGIAYTASVPAAITVAHDFQSYPKNAAQAKGFNSLLDLFGRSQLVAGTSPDQMARLITYLAPARSALGISPQDIIATAALASNVGLSSGHGGGSTVAALFRTIVPAMTTFGAAHNRALMSVEKAGKGSFFDSKGQFEGVANMLNVVMRAMAATPSHERRLGLLQAAFQTTGSRAFSLLATPGAIGRYQSIQGLLGPHGLPSTQAMQTGLNSTIQGQMATFQGNLTSIKALLGQQLLPAIAPVLHAFVELTGSIVTLLRTHPQVAQFVTTLLAVSTAAALIAGPVLMAAGAFGILSAAGFTFDLAFLPFTAIILGIVAAVTAVTLVITHWSDIMAWAGQHATLLHNILFGLSILFPPLGIVIGVAVLAFQYWGDIVHVVQTILSAFGTFLRPFAAVFGPLLQAIGLLAGGLWTVLNTTDMLKSSLSSLSAPFVVLGTDINTAHKALDALLAKLPHGGASGGKGGTPLLQGFVHALVPVLPGGTILNPFLTGLGVGGGGYVPHAPSTGSAYDMPPIQRRTQPVWDMPPIQRRGAQGAAPVYHLHIAPGAVGPIHVHGADHHDEEALAKRVGAHVVRDLGDELVHTLTSGAPSVFGLSPILNVPAPR